METRLEYLKRRDNELTNEEERLEDEAVRLEDEAVRLDKKLQTIRKEINKVDKEIRDILEFKPLGKVLHGAKLKEYEESKGTYVGHRIRISDH